MAAEQMQLCGHIAVNTFFNATEPTDYYVNFV